MRINPGTTAAMLDALARTQAAQESALQEISSGKRITLASDDPDGMAAWILNRFSADQNDQFSTNVAALKSQLETADSTLNSVVEVLQKAITLGVQASTGTLSDSNRNAIAQEITGIQNTILSLANTTYEGSYLFSGTATATQPFVREESAEGEVRYDGNTKTSQAAIGVAQTIQTGIPGDQIFNAEDASVFRSLQSLLVGLQNNDSKQITSATSNIRDAFNNVTSQRIFYGNATNSLDSYAELLAGDKLEFQQEEDTIAGADPAEAITNFMNAALAHNAVLNAASKVSNLSLLDYLH